jgi:hypothetical protein
VNALFPGGSDGGAAADAPEPRLEQILDDRERVARWEVRAAQWRAHELALEAFGGPVRMHLMGMRLRGPMRGLLEMGVPFEDLDVHRAREARFLAAVSADPVLSRIPLVYVLGPHAG